MVFGDERRERPGLCGRCAGMLAHASNAAGRGCSTCAPSPTALPGLDHSCSGSGGGGGGSGSSPPALETSTHPQRCPGRPPACPPAAARPPAARRQWPAALQHNGLSEYRERQVVSTAVKCVQCCAPLGSAPPVLSGAATERQQLGVGVMHCMHQNTLTQSLEPPHLRGLAHAWPQQPQRSAPGASVWLVSGTTLPSCMRACLVFLSRCTGGAGWEGPKWVEHACGGGNNQPVLWPCLQVCSAHAWKFMQCHAGWCGSESCPPSDHCLPAPCRLRCHGRRSGTT